MQRGPSARHMPQRPTLTPNHSRYLSPVQHARIESWRSSASTAVSTPVSSPTSPPHPLPPTSPASRSKTKVKSAPASLDLLHPSHSTPSHGHAGHPHLGITPASSYSPCVTCAARSLCSCSTSSPRHRVYYSNKKTKTNTTATSGQMPVTPPTGSIGIAVGLAGADGPNKRGLPTPEQVRAYAMGHAPTAQYGPVQVGLVPPGEVAMPKPDAPRIAGVRDPISQN